MQKNTVVILSSLVLLLVIPGIALSDVFAEKLIVVDGFDDESEDAVPAQFSALDKTSGTEIQLFSDYPFELFFSGIDFTFDGLIASSTEDNEQLDFYKISLTIVDGEPKYDATEINNAVSACTGISSAPDGTLYCLNASGLHTVDLDAGDATFIGSTGIVEDYLGAGLAVSPEGIIYLGNQIGLYTLDSDTGAATLVVEWNHYDGDGEGIIDEPHSVSPNEFTECITKSMDFDSLGMLYAIMICDEDSYILTKIGVNPSIIEVEVLNEDDELVVVEQADLTLFFLERNGSLGDVYELNTMFTDAMAFSPFDFDFLLGTTYGTVISGFDSITASADGSITTDGTAEIKICDNTILSLGIVEAVIDGCILTTVTVESGSIVATFEPDDEDIENPISTLSAEDSITFDSKKCKLTNVGTTDIFVDFEGETIILQEGEKLSCGVAIDHYLGYKAKVKHNDKDDDDDGDKKSKYEEYLKYFEENDSKKYKKYLKYLKYFDGDDDDKSEKYFKHAKSYYEKHHDKTHHDHDHGHKHHGDDKLQVTLVDAFTDEVKYNVKKLKILYNPVDVDIIEVESEESHLVGYDIKKSKGEPKFKKIKNIVVNNQFGELTVDIKKVKMLLVPSSKDHDSTPDPLEDIIINSFKCYNAKESKGTDKFVKTNVFLDDQFTDEPITMKVKKLKMLCSSTSIDGEEILDDENYLMCYEVKKTKDTPKFTKQNVFTTNQFGSDELDVKKPSRLCVPSTIVLP